MKKRIGYEKSYIRLLYNLKYTDRNEMILILRKHT